MNGKIEEWKDRGMEGQRNERIEEWNDRGMEGQRNERIEEWKDGGMCECVWLVCVGNILSVPARYC
jgi:hypothetical protein